MERIIAKQEAMLNANAVAITKRIHEEILKDIPVDTGYMKTQQHYRVERDSEYITLRFYNRAYYAIYVHQGTGRQALYGLGNKSISGQRPQQFIKIPVDRNRRNVSTWIVSGVNR